LDEAIFPRHREDKAMKKPTPRKPRDSKSKKAAVQPKPVKISDADFWRWMGGELNIKTAEELDAEIAALGGAKAIRDDPEKLNTLVRKIYTLPKLPSDRVAGMLQGIRERLPKAS
jgi:hypothetical protein